MSTNLERVAFNVREVSVDDDADVEQEDAV